MKSTSPFKVSGFRCVINLHPYIQGRNENERKIHEQVFSERIQAESAIKEVEGQIGNVMGEMEQKLRELAPAKRKAG